MVCKYCNGKIKNNICIKYLMPIDIKKKQKNDK